MKTVVKIFIVAFVVVFVASPYSYAADCGYGRTSCAEACHRDPLWILSCTACIGSMSTCTGVSGEYLPSGNAWCGTQWSGTILFFCACDAEGGVCGGRLAVGC
ncbi:MAG: hypothetical protein US03_C0001G0001 [candidate division TM6 bacterium GW2011_GWF2_36_131]|nr:MAG: hypothetical protein US03_C0001G0001 [candidate division TM6 bacterium GW2011_GWF2_36_131]